MCKHNQQDTASPRADARPAAADCVQKQRSLKVAVNYPQCDRAVPD
ncbi:hypothetical protein [Nostoc sp.]